MEENRYKLESYNETFCEIHDTKKDEWYIRKDLVVDLLNKQDKQITELQKQLEEKEKYTYTGKEVGEIERKYDEKIKALEQQLKSQPA